MDMYSNYGLTTNQMYSLMKPVVKESLEKLHIVYNLSDADKYTYHLHIADDTYVDVYQFYAMMKKIILRLEHRQVKVIGRRFGLLKGYKLPMGYTAIGDDLHVSYARVKHIYDKAIKKLCHYLIIEMDKG
jgi:DNA-directed RNA polymerase sigma subunit (sigma70/sigma32)